MQDARPYRCTFYDEAGKVIGFDSCGFPDDNTARQWAEGLKAPGAAKRRELRDDQRMVHEAKLAATDV